LIDNLLADFLDDIEHLLTVLGFFLPLQTTSQIKRYDKCLSSLEAIENNGSCIAHLFGSKFPINIPFSL
jgi:hypothetical protein